MALTYSAVAQYSITDSFGKHDFDSPPKRVVITDWALVEQAIELGIIPVGAPELETYKKYVRLPELPDGVSDIGLRQAPNMAKIRALKPDLIILGTDQKDLVRPFSKIARIVYYQSLSEHYRDNYAKAKQRFIGLAELFQRTNYAYSKLIGLELQLKLFNKKLSEHFNHTLPKVGIVRLNKNDVITAYGGNSLSQTVLERLGLENQFEIEISKWGDDMIRFNTLQELNTGFLFYKEPVDSTDILNSQKWTELPLYKNNTILPLAPINSYGGIMSGLYLADEIVNKLIAHE